tara:strand:- start:97 stop:498 length:402 start_codon:yes stop_codon:yes gene_type:complete
MSEIEILKKFKDTVISFLDELISQFPQEANLVIFRIFLKDRVPIVDVINYFVRKVLPLKNMVESRNEDFFLNHCTLMEDINNQKTKGRVNHFKKLWRSETLDDEDKEVVWQWFDTFITLSEKYQKNILAVKKI